MTYRIWKCYDKYYNFKCLYWYWHILFLKLEYTFFKYACWLVVEDKKKYAEKWLGDSKPEGAYVTESKENAISLFHDAIQWTT